MTNLADTARVVGDTLCYRHGEGYDRTVIYSHWDDLEPRRLAKASIRVDRRPENSFAHIHVWTSSGGWQFVSAIGPGDFWPRMPGYTRDKSINADRDTLNLADELLDALIEIGI